MYDGLVVFEQYESDAAVQRAVQRGDAECGYVLPETLALCKSRRKSTMPSDGTRILAGFCLRSAVLLSRAPICMDSTGWGSAICSNLALDVRQGFF